MALPQLWSVRQRSAVLVFVVLTAGYLIFENWRQQIDVSDPQPAAGARAGELADRVDPNTADVSELAGLPMMGEKRAAEIVAYRETFAQSHPNRVAFHDLRDLLLLKNFGASTVSSLEPYLIFPPAPTATRPSH